MDLPEAASGTIPTNLVIPAANHKEVASRRPLEHLKAVRLWQRYLKIIVWVGKRWSGSAPHDDTCAGLGWLESGHTRQT